MKPAKRKDVNKLNQRNPNAYLIFDSANIFPNQTT